MDLLQLLRTFGALGTVLGLLAGALWVVRRYNIKLPGRIGTGPRRRLEIVERLTLDNRRSVALIRRDGREHLILLGPEGSLMIEPGIERAAAEPAAAPPSPRQAAAPAAKQAAATPVPAPSSPVLGAASGDLRASLARLASMIERARETEQPLRLPTELRSALSTLAARAGQARADAPAAVEPIEPAPVADFRDALAQAQVQAGQGDWLQAARERRQQRMSQAEPAHA